MRLAELAGLRPSAATRACYRRLPAAAPEDYRQLAALLIDHWRHCGARIVGVGGGQGAGKSTLGALLHQAGALRGLRVQVLSIDDFYLPKAERQRLAADVHPLLATRGPPGTHDVALLRRTLQALAGGGDTARKTVAMPKFDKGLDDRVGEVSASSGMDLVVLEGWCVGAGPGKPEELREPVNALERTEDPDGHWRQHVEAALGGDYAELNEDLQSLLFLQVPDIAAVRRWRLRQEGERPPAQRMTLAQVERFVAHYERITRRMMAELPGSADVLVRLDDAHQVADLRFGIQWSDQPDLAE